MRPSPSCSAPCWRWPARPRSRRRHERREAVAVARARGRVASAVRRSRRRTSPATHHPSSSWSHASAATQTPPLDVERAPGAVRSASSGRWALTWRCSSSGATRAPSSRVSRAGTTCRTTYTSRPPPANEPVEVTIRRSEAEPAATGRLKTLALALNLSAWLDLGSRARLGVSAGPAWLRASGHAERLVFTSSRSAATRCSSRRTTSSPSTSRRAVSASTSGGFVDADLGRVVGVRVDVRYVWGPERDADVALREIVNASEIIRSLPLAEIEAGLDPAAAAPRSLVLERRPAARLPLLSGRSGRSSAGGARSRAGPTAARRRSGPRSRPARRRRSRPSGRSRRRARRRGPSPRAGRRAGCAPARRSPARAPLARAPRTTSRVRKPARERPTHRRAATLRRSPVRRTWPGRTDAPMSALASAQPFTAASHPSMSFRGSASAMPSAWASRTAAVRDRPCSMRERTRLVVLLSVPRKDRMRAPGRQRATRLKTGVPSITAPSWRKQASLSRRERAQRAQGKRHGSLVRRHHVQAARERLPHVARRRLAGAGVEGRDLDQHVGRHPRDEGPRVAPGHDPGEASRASRRARHAAEPGPRPIPRGSIASPWRAVAMPVTRTRAPAARSARA